MYVFSICNFSNYFSFCYFNTNKTFSTKKYLNVLTQDEFIKGYRKAQLIDIREPQEFERGYIRGARNLPLTQMKQKLVELRPDKQVYLYCLSNISSKLTEHLLNKID